jgi:hypothetical protein
MIIFEKNREAIMLPLFVLCDILYNSMVVAQHHYSPISTLNYYNGIEAVYKELP